MRLRAFSVLRDGIAQRGSSGLVTASPEPSSIAFRGAAHPICHRADGGKVSRCLQTLSDRLDPEPLRLAVGPRGQSLCKAAKLELLETPLQTRHF